QQREQGQPQRVRKRAQRPRVGHALDGSGVTRRHVCKAIFRKLPLQGYAGPFVMVAPAITFFCHGCASHHKRGRVRLPRPRRGGQNPGNEGVKGAVQPWNCWSGRRFWTRWPSTRAKPGGVTGGWSWCLVSPAWARPSCSKRSSSTCP